MPLQPVTLPGLGFLGLNKAKRDVPLGPQWATEARNCIVDAAGRLAARKGHVVQTTTPATGTPTMTALHEFVQNDGTLQIVAGTATKLWHSVDEGLTWVDKTGSLTPSGNGNWQFANFNSKVFAAQVGNPLCVKTTTGDFATITASSGSVPNNPVAIWAAYGRLWCIGSDYQTLYWCALLDHTKWATADGAGSQDLGYLWTRGTDQGVGIGAFGSTLAVFGKRHIFLFTDGSGSDRGLDPSTMYVGDTIEGVGLAARDSLQQMGEGDLMFLSQNGIRSMSRVLQEKQTPLNDITGNNRDWTNGLFLATTVDSAEFRSVVSPENGFYLLVAPDSNLTLCVDIRQPLEDGTYRIFNWTGFVPYSMMRRLDGSIWFGLTGGEVSKYTGYLDDGATYRFAFRSGFLDLGEGNTPWKMLKRLKLIAYSPGAVTAVFKWWWDFQRTFSSANVTYEGDGTSEYNVDNYDVAEYSGGSSQRISNIPASGSGQYFQIGLEVEINGAPFALQSVTAYYDTGRVA